MLFKNRQEAGERLVQKLRALKLENPLVICLPRGGVPIGSHIAKALELDLDVLVVRKIGAPQNPEFGVGAIAEEGFARLDTETIEKLGLAVDDLDPVIATEKIELGRRILKYRGARPLTSVEGRHVLLVDDGLATGVTASLAADYLQFSKAQKITLCVPVCSSAGRRQLEKKFDQVICLEEPDPFYGVAAWYDEFPQLTDEEVLRELASFYPEADDRVMEVLRHAKPFRQVMDLGPLIDRVKDARVVMLGEASHGTHEFYQWRTHITQELISKHGFNFIAVEGDWPACTSIDRFIRSRDAETADQALREFRRWPTWMWANDEVAELADWLKKRNVTRSEEDQTGFYGLDVYSLFESIDSVLEQTQKIAPELVPALKHHYRCFEPYARNERKYLKSLMGFKESCEVAVLRALKDLMAVRMESLKRGNNPLFDAIQNARIIKNAERYYRAMVFQDDQSWNIRDRHMIETLNVLLKHHGPQSKAIIWAHNTHIGDYRATDMVDHGHINLGGLAREELGNSQVALVGFGSHRGKVIASSAWDGLIEEMSLPEARPGSLEDLLHAASVKLGNKDFYLLLDPAKKSLFSEARGHRAVGVVYDPGHEESNYVPTILDERYDAFLFLDETRALSPMNLSTNHKEIPETFPAGV